jgi:hypothetical protein
MKTLTRERVNEMKREAQNSLLPDEHKAEAVALCDMALRYRDLLEQEPVAKQIRYVSSTWQDANEDEYCVCQKYPKDYETRLLIVAPGGE